MKGFIYSCIGDNTPENREHLERLGITKTIGIVGNTIMVVDGRYMCFELEGNIGNNFNDAVNCIGNPALFQAVSAVRDDSDMWQWYTDGKIWMFSRGKECFEMYLYNDVFGKDYKNWHKASLTELKEHFK